MSERYEPIEEIRKQAEKDRTDSKEFREKEKKKRKNRAALLVAAALTTIGVGGYKAVKAESSAANNETAPLGEISPETEQQEAVEGIQQQDIQEDAQKEYERLVEEEAERQKAEIRESLNKE